MKVDGGRSRAIGSGGRLSQIPVRGGGVLVLLTLIAVPIESVRAQGPNIRYGEAVPRDVREMYDRGLQSLASTQTDKGDWQGSR
jgi:hypothetical protein